MRSGVRTEAITILWMILEGVLAVLASVRQRHRTAERKRVALENQERVVATQRRSNIVRLIWIAHEAKQAFEGARGE